VETAISYVGLFLEPAPIVQSDFLFLVLINRLRSRSTSVNIGRRRNCGEPSFHFVIFLGLNVRFIQENDHFVDVSHITFIKFEMGFHQLVAKSRSSQ
jgi:hypothetical protein